MAVDPAIWPAIITKERLQKLLQFDYIGIIVKEYFDSNVKVSLAGIVLVFQIVVMPTNYYHYKNFQ